MIFGKCPKCDQLVTSLTGSTIKMTIDETIFSAVTLNCPLCLTVLGAQIDPIAVKADTVDEVIDGLKS